MKKQIKEQGEKSMFLKVKIGGGGDFFNMKIIRYTVLKFKVGSI